MNLVDPQKQPMNQIIALDYLQAIVYLLTRPFTLLFSTSDMIYRSSRGPWHGMVYGMTWRAGKVYGMACWAWHGICYGLARHDMVYGMS